MSRIFGPMRQIGYVVRDLRAAAGWWIDEAGIGPWFLVEDTVVPEIVYRGGAPQTLQLSGAFANSGDMQIELIQQLCTTPSIYTDPGPFGGRLHHVSSWPEPDAEDEVRGRAIAAGYAVEMEALGERGQFAYFAKPGKPRLWFETAALLPWRKAFFDRVRMEAVNWDGRDPVRDWRGRAL